MKVGALAFCLALGMGLSGVQGAPRAATPQAGAWHVVTWNPPTIVPPFSSRFRMAIDAAGNTYAQEHVASRHVLDSDLAAGYPIAWGHNWAGQLGDGKCCFRRTAPGPVSGLSGVVSLAAGMGYSVAVRSDGTVWQWGCCDRNQKPRPLPVQVSGVGAAVGVATGLSHALALLRDGTVWTWATNSETATRVKGLAGVTAVAAGGYFYLALESDGSVWSWGLNDAAQLGTGKVPVLGGNSYYPVPERVTDLSNVIGIAAGENYALALKNDGTVWSWGARGALGRSLDQSQKCPIRLTQSTPYCSAVPGIVTGVPHTVAIAAGGFHAMAIASDGSLWTWGRNTDGELGMPVTSFDVINPPRRVLGLSRVALIAGGRSHSLVATTDGAVWAWGYAGDGRLGATAPQGVTCQCITTPVRVKGAHGVLALAAGWDHSLAIARTPVSRPKPRLCEGGPQLLNSHHFPRSVRLPGVLTMAVSERTGHVFITGKGWYDCEPSVTMLDAGTGAPRAVAAVDGTPGGIVAAEGLGRTLILGRRETPQGTSGSVTIVDSTRGRVVRTVRLKLAVEGLAVDNRTDRAFVLTHPPQVPSDFWNLTTLSVSTGSILRSTHVGTVGTLAIDESTHHLFVLQATSAVMLDSRDGRVLRRIPMQPGPRLLDGQTSRMFVAAARPCRVEPLGKYTALAIQVFDTRTGALLKVVDGTCRYRTLDPQLVLDQRLGTILLLQSSHASGTAELRDPQLDGLLLDPRTGEILRRFDSLWHNVPGSVASQYAFDPVPAAVDGLTGAVYFARFGVGIVKFDLRRWRLTWVARLGGVPEALTVALRERNILVTIPERHVLLIARASR